MNKGFLQGAFMLAILLFVGAGCPTQSAPGAGVAKKQEPAVDVVRLQENVVLKMEQGKIMMEGALETELQSDIMMPDGTKVMMDGRVMMSNGEWLMMKEGDSVMMENGKASLKVKQLIEDQVVTDVPATAEAKAGSYEGYDQAKLTLANVGKVVLFFAAGWCPTCKAADANLSKATIPTGVYVLKVDYDNSTELKKKYGVTYQHTFVQVDAQGNMLKKWSGSTTVEEIESQLK